LNVEPKEMLNAAFLMREQGTWGRGMATEGMLNEVGDRGNDEL